MNAMIKLGQSACLATLLAAGSSAVQAASVQLIGPNAAVLAGSSFVVSVQGLGFIGLDGGGADFSFTPDLIELIDVNVDAGWNFYTEPGTINNAEGKLTGLSFNVWGPKSGNFAIASLTFRAKAAGNASIDVMGSDMWPFGLGGEVVATNFAGTQVQISAVPEPAAWLLMAGGLVALGIRRARTAV